MRSTRRSPARKKRPFYQSFLATAGPFIVFLAILLAVFQFHQNRANAALSSVDSGWQIHKVAKNHEIEGYTSQVSTTPGSRLGFHISCKSASFRVNIYRMGLASGKNNNLVEKLANRNCQQRPIPTPSPDTGLVNPQWPVNFSLQIPNSWASGVYLAKLTNSNGFQNYVPFTIRPSTPHSNYLFIHGINTDVAYNLWGGNSLYSGYTRNLNIQRAVEASLNRPFSELDGSQDGSGDFLKWEYPMIKFLERNKYSVDYATDIDIQQNPSLLLKYKTIILAGHNEYWSKQMFDGYDKAVKHGVALAIFGGNTAFRPVRFQPDPATGAPDRIMVNYKSADLDPFTKTNQQYSTPASWISPPLNRPESQLLGIGYGGEIASSSRGYDLVVSDDSSWIFKDTGLENGDKLRGLVGYEYDRMRDNQPHPKGVDIVFHSPAIDHAGKAGFADSSYYALPSGGQVFNAGSIQWSWGLNPSSPNYSPALVKVTKNILNNFARGLHLTILSL